MIPADDTSELSPVRNLESEISVGAPIASAGEVVKIDLSGDPLASVAILQPPMNRWAWLPEDLRISWSWAHVLIFLVVGFGSLLTIQLAAVMMVAGNQRMSQKQLEELMMSKPQLLIGSNLLWFAFLFFFLFVTLSMLREAPFWRSLGWRRLATTTGKPIQVWKFFGVGCGLALCVGLLTSRVKQPDNAPIEAIFKNRSGALLFMSMAVLVAPLVEETIFRGYLYPFFAGKFALLAKASGNLDSSSIFFGRICGILVTGVLFGLMHGVQLGWTFGLVATLTMVGIVLTFVRARTGSVFASFLVHLGYNTMIAITSIVVTKGFTQMPTMPPGH